MSARRRSWQREQGFWPSESPWQILARQAAALPDEVLFVADDERLTARDVEDRACRLAGGLRAIGIGPGDVVTWQLPSWIEGVYLTFALDRIGAISNPVLPIYRQRELSWILREARPRMLIIPGEIRGFDHRLLASEIATADLEHVAVVRAEPRPGQFSFSDLLASDRDAESPVERSFDVAHSLFYTSGTTSEPKGVVHSVATLLSFVRLQSELFPDDAGRVSILWFPLTHIGGVCAFALQPVVTGTRAVFVEPFDPERSLELIESEQVSAAGAPTPILQALLAAPGFSPERVRSVRVSGIGATDVPPELVRQVGEDLGAFVYRSYGLTECPMATAGRLGDAADKLVGTDGREVSGVEIRLVDPTGAVTSSEGEIEVAGPQLCLGYADAGRTAEAFTGDGFLRTGDLARIDEDGFVTITGRTKEIILRKGENLSARAIEDEVRSLPMVADVAVFAVPDPQSGECACACIVPADPARPPALEDIQSAMRGRSVMAQKIPEQLFVVAELPRTPTGKVRKHELREQFLSSTG